MSAELLALPSLPWVPGDPMQELPASHRKENLLFLARWVLAHRNNLEMEAWHSLSFPGIDTTSAMRPPFCRDAAHADEWAAHCGTTHCVAGHAVAMAGPVGFRMEALAFESGYIDNGTAWAALQLVDPSTEGPGEEALDLWSLFFQFDEEVVIAYLEDLVSPEHQGDKLPAFHISKYETSWD